MKNSVIFIGLDPYETKIKKSKYSFCLKSETRNLMDHLRSQSHPPF